MAHYKIIGETNGWIAERDIKFNGKTKITIDKDLSLQDAQKRLLDMYNSYYEDERPYAKNWGLAVIHSQKHREGANQTSPNGTRSFDFDSRCFSIVEQNEDEEEA